MNWVAYAYERQFFSIPVPRASNRRFASRLYGWLFRGAGRFGQLNRWYRIDELVVRVQQWIRRREASELTKSMCLDCYRRQATELFDRYGRSLGL